MINLVAKKFREIPLNWQVRIINLAMELLKNNPKLQKKAAPFIYNVFDEKSMIGESLARRATLTISKMLNEFPSPINNGTRHLDILLNLIQKLNLEGSIIDIGAANGEFTKHIINVLPNYNIIAFEPNPESFKILKHEVENFPQVRVFNIALGARSGLGVLNVTERVDSSSLLEPCASSFDSKHSSDLSVSHQVNTQLETLDNFITEQELVAALKIDVQGYEFEIFKGATKTLGKTSVVCVEMQNHADYLNAPKYSEIDAFLIGAGFYLYDIVPGIKKNGQLYEWDGIYLKNHLLSSLRS